MKLPDIFSLIGIFFSWVSILLIISVHTPIAIFTIMIAFTCDLADGYIARRTGQHSPWGNILDSLGDVLLYLVAPLLLIYTTWQLPSLLFYILSGEVIICGIYRLARFSQVGLKQDAAGKVYYEGMIVVYMAVALFFAYALKMFSMVASNYIASAFMLALSPLMVMTSIKTPKVSNIYIISLLALLLAGLLYVTSTRY